MGLTATRSNGAAFSYGFDRVRFVRPVFVGDTIRPRVTLADKRPDPKQNRFGRVVERIEVIDQHEKVVLACDHVPPGRTQGPAAPGRVVSGA